MRARGLVSLVRAAGTDLFDQSTAFGRLALVHVAMMAGDTLVTVSLAGSLFFSVSPSEAKGKVLLYLLLTLAPFAIVSPLLGPLIDRSSNGRRILVAISAVARGVLCLSMAQHLNSLWLFPEAFVVLVSSKLYVVTRGTLVPEMARTDQFKDSEGLDDAGWPDAAQTSEAGYAGFNAQLTLLGTMVGLLAGSVGAGILKGIGGPSVLVVAALVYFGATAASLRLRRPSARVAVEASPLTPLERDLAVLQPHGDPAVRWGLAASSTVRAAIGFTTFLLAFGLRREHASLGWFAAALLLSGFGSLVGLALVTRLRRRLSESTLLSSALLAIGVGALAAAQDPNTLTQVALAAWLGAAASIAQPSFDAITQRHVSSAAQGRTFARFSVRQQLAWVLGALIPVGVSMSFVVGDWLVATLCVTAGLTYLVGRRGL